MRGAVFHEIRGFLWKRSFFMKEEHYIMNEDFFWKGRNSFLWKRSIFFMKEEEQFLWKRRSSLFMKEEEQFFYIYLLLSFCTIHLNDTVFLLWQFHVDSADILTSNTNEEMVVPSALSVPYTSSSSRFSISETSDATINTDLLSPPIIFFPFSQKIFSFLWQYHLLMLFINVRYIHSRTMYVVPMERALKDDSNHTKYSKSPKID